MQQTRKCILINSGPETRRNFITGLGSMPFEHYYSKRMILHIDPNGTQNFIYKNTSVDFTDSFVYTRLRGTDPHFCGMIYTYLAHHRIAVNDPISKSFPYSAGKIAQMLFLALVGIRIPETIIFREESYSTNREYIKTHMTFPLVYKTDGSKGRNVHIVDSLETLDTLVAEKKAGRLALIQQFIENTYDTRTLIVHGEVIGSMKRTRSHGYLNNIAQGATASAITLPERDATVARKAAAACGIDFGGVDLIHTDEGPVVLEVNKSPQVGGFESVHDFKVFTKVAEIMKQKFG